MTKTTFKARVRAIAKQSAKASLKTSSTGTITATVSFPATAVDVLAGALYDEMKGVVPAPTPTPTPTPTPPPAPPAATLYKAPQQVDAFVATYPELSRIADQPQAVWLGAWSEPVETTVRTHCNAAKAAGQIPLFALYMIPGRDMGGFSAGGSKTPEEYRAYVDSVARGFSTPAIVVLEPDAIVHDTNPERVALISYAVDMLTTTGSKIYIDAGHPRWHSAEEMANRLHLSNVKAATGFALNTSNFVTTDLCHAYGDEISRRLAALGAGEKHYVIDTSRNGNPVMPEPWDWANPKDRWLGANPTLQTGHAGCDAYLWVKAVGESDGWGGIHAAEAGKFVPEIALELIRASQKQGG
ncbi:MAG: glycoside hydrolase family 6 protein [Chloroflexota bacterium]|nr:glycoside hydrolase family 6 protein [Chloroflexota bacterium]